MIGLKKFESKINGFESVYVLVALFCLLLYVVRLIFSNGQTLAEVFQSTDLVDTGMDFFNSIVCTKDGEPYVVFKTLYPPLANLFFYLCYKIIPIGISANWQVDYNDFTTLRGTAFDLRVWQSSLMIFMVYIQIMILACYALFSRYLKSHSHWIAISLIFSVSMLYALERGNIIILCMLLVMYFLFNFNSEEKYKRYISILCLAIAIGLKIYPVIFSLLLLKEKRYRDFIVTGIISALLFFLPFLMFGGYDGFIQWFDVLKFVGKGTYKAIGHDYVSLVQGVRTVLESKYWPYEFFEYKILIIKLAQYFTILSSIFLLCSIFFERRLWRNCLALVLIIIFATQHSPYYNTVFLLPVFIMFLNSEKIYSTENILTFVFWIIIFCIIPFMGHYKIAFAVRFLSILSMVLWIVIDTVISIIFLLKCKITNK